MKKMLCALMLLLMLIPALGLAEEELLFGEGVGGDAIQGPVLLVELPEDAQTVEERLFDDGDFIQSYQLSGEVTVQLLRFGVWSTPLSDLADDEWPGYVPVQAPALEQVSGYPTETLSLTWSDGTEAVDVTYVLVYVDGQTLIFQTVAPQGTQDGIVRQMLDSLSVLGGEIDEQAEVG